MAQEAFPLHFTPKTPRVTKVSNIFQSNFPIFITYVYIVSMKLKFYLFLGFIPIKTSDNSNLK